MGRFPSRLATHDWLVLDYLEARPGSTAQEITQGAFAEEGRPRTYGRRAVANSLIRLHGAGEVRKEPPEGEYGRGSADRWWPT